MAVRVVCISHATGAGGDLVARQVAERLGFLHVDEEIVSRAAAQGGLDPGDVADEERRKSLAGKILDALAQGDVGGAALGPPGAWTPSDAVSSADIRALIRETIVQTAARGDVVISAHAASHALLSSPDTLRVLVTASAGTRAKNVAESEGLDDAAAARAVKDADAGRRDYLRRFYDVDDEQPVHYDLVVNTDRLSPEQAAEVVVAAAALPAVVAAT